MGYYDPPEFDEYLGCPCCGLEEELLEEDQETGELYCPRCQKNVNWLWENEGNFYCLIPQEPELELDEGEIDLIELELFHQKAEEEHLKELGLMTENGELTSEYYRIADQAYDAFKDRRWAKKMIVSHEIQSFFVETQLDFIHQLNFGIHRTTHRG